MERGLLIFVAFFRRFFWTIFAPTLITPNHTSPNSIAPPPLAPIYPTSSNPSIFNINYHYQINPIHHSALHIKLNITTLNPNMDNNLTPSVSLPPLPDAQETSVPPSKPSNNDESDDFRRVQLKTLAPVATWSWVLEADTCSICRNSLMSVCVKCQASTSSDSNKCRVSWGNCNHAFHLHCITEWTNTRRVCPIDEKPWVQRDSASIVGTS